MDFNPALRLIAQRIAAGEVATPTALTDLSAEVQQGLRRLPSASTVAPLRFPDAWTADPASAAARELAESYLRVTEGFSAPGELARLTELGEALGRAISEASPDFRRGVLERSAAWNAPIDLASGRPAQIREQLRAALDDRAFTEFLGGPMFSNQGRAARPQMESQLDAVLRTLYPEPAPVSRLSSGLSFSPLQALGSLPGLRASGGGPKVDLGLGLAPGEPLTAGKLAELLLAPKQIVSGLGEARYMTALTGRDRVLESGHFPVDNIFKVTLRPERTPAGVGLTAEVELTGILGAEPEAATTRIGEALRARTAAYTQARADGLPPLEAARS